MKINYPSDAERAATRRGPKESKNTVGVIAFAVIIIGAGIVSAMWYFFSQEKNAQPAETPQPAATAPVPVPVLDRQPYSPSDGFTQCNSRTPDVSSDDARRKRTLCYYAVMVIFDTGDVCTLPQIDASARSLCAQARVLYEQHASEQDQESVAPKTPTVAQTQSNGIVVIPPPGSGSGGSGSSGQGNANTNGNANSTGNTNGGSNANGNSNGNSNGNTNTNVNGNTNGTVNSNTNGNANGNTNEPPDPVQPCYDESGQIVLLQHTNICD